MPIFALCALLSVYVMCSNRTHAELLTLVVGGPVHLGHGLDKADAIFCMRIKAIEQVGESEIDYFNIKLPGHLMVADCEIDRVIKGPKTDRIKLRYFVTSLSRNGFALTKPPRDHRFLLAVQDAGDGHYIPTEYVALAVRLAPDPPEIPEGANTQQAVQAEILAAAQAKDPRTSRAALELLDPEDEQTRRFLDAAMEDPDLHIRSVALRLRVQANDPKAVEAATTLVESPDCPEHIASALAFSFRSVKKKKAIAALHPAIFSKHLAVRRAAAQALRMHADLASISILAQGLTDPDLEVQYQSIMGMARLTDKMEDPWAIAYEGFAENPIPVARLWLRWWDRNQDRYPSPAEEVKPRAHQASQDAPQR